KGPAYHPPSTKPPWFCWLGATKLAQTEPRRHVSSETHPQGPRGRLPALTRADAPGGVRQQRVVRLRADDHVERGGDERSSTQDAPVRPVEVRPRTILSRNAAAGRRPQAARRGTHRGSLLRHQLPV